MGKLLVLLSCVLLTSGLYSMVEAAILSTPLVKARILYDQKRRGSKDLLILKENIHSVIATIVILNNSTNIIGSIFVGQEVIRIFGNQWLALASACVTFLIVVIAEIIPKTIGEHYKVGVSLASAKALRFITWLFTPLVFVLIIAGNIFKKSHAAPKVTEDEIRIMLKFGRDAGTVELNEESLCNKVFKLNDLKASNMMRPIDQIYALPAESTLMDEKDNILNSQYSRIAVCDKDKANIIGITQQTVLLREMAKDNYTAKIKDFISRPVFVNEDEKANSLLNKFQAYHQHLFIVRDKAARSIGIIAMEDVLEELFGEIYDEKDKV